MYFLFSLNKTKIYCYCKNCKKKKSFNESSKINTMKWLMYAFYGLVLPLPSTLASILPSLLPAGLPHLRSSLSVFSSWLFACCSLFPHWPFYALLCFSGTGNLHRVFLCCLVDDFLLIFSNKNKQTNTGRRTNGERKRGDTFFWFCHVTLPPIPGVSNSTIYEERAKEREELASRLKKHFFSGSRHTMIMSPEQLWAWL